MRLPTLYKRTKKGQIQQWSIVVENNSFYTIEGIVKGKLTSSIPTVCEAKNIGRANETSPEDQAEKEARALWQKKLDRNYHDSIERCDIKRFFEPMLAEDYHEFKHKIEFPIFSQPKLDGIRCIANKDGLWSRNGKPFVSCKHIYNYLKPLFDKHPNLIFDGELYCDKYKHNFNKISSYVRTSKSLTPEKINMIESELEYWVFDFPSHSGNFSERYEQLTSIFSKAKFPIVLVSTTVANNHSDLDSVYYETYLDQGFEGQIIRVDTPYEKCRTQNLLKRKEFIDTEFKIVGVIEGRGNRSGTVGKFVLELPNGETFESNIKADFEYLKELLINREILIGKVVTVRYGKLSPDGVPIWPYVIDIRDYE